MVWETYPSIMALPMLHRVLVEKPISQREPIGQHPYQAWLGERPKLFATLGASWATRDSRKVMGSTGTMWFNHCWWIWFTKWFTKWFTMVHYISLWFWKRGRIERMVASECFDNQEWFIMPKKYWNQNIYWLPVHFPIKQQVTLYRFFPENIR